jgi:hypothetical protein
MEDVASLRLCRDCGDCKTTSEFWASEVKLKRPSCIACSKKKQAAWRDKNRNKTRKKHAAWRDAHPGKNLQYSLKRRYSITVERYQEMLNAQDGLCACCGRPGEGGALRLLVDHDHDTGEIRGLICRRCNTGIGMLGDDADGVRRALDYLERWRASVVPPPLPSGPS